MERMNTYFEITYRGVKASVEPAGISNRWEMCVDDGRGNNDWFPVGCGDYPAVPLDAARAAAVKRLKEEYHPAALRRAYADLERAAKRIAELKAE